MPFSLQEYSDYPYGKGVTIVTNLNQIKENYKAELNKIKEHIRVKAYKLKNRSIIIHIQFPSQEVNMKYDVVFQFNTDNLLDYKELRYIPMRVFSNSPSFTFTYGYAFVKNGLMIPWLGNKAKYSATHKSDTRNPNNIIGIERSLYLSTLYLLNDNILSILGSRIIPIENTKYLESIILSHDQIMQKRSYLRIKEAKNRKIPSIEKDRDYKPSHRRHSTKGIATTGSIKEIKHVGANKSIGKTKKIGSIKTIKKT